MSNTRANQEKPWQAGIGYQKKKGLWLLSFLAFLHRSYEVVYGNGSHTHDFNGSSETK